MKRFEVKGKDIVIEAESVEEIGEEPFYPDGTFLRCLHRPEVYYIQNKERRWVKTHEVWKKMSADLEVAWGNIKVLTALEWDKFLDSVQEGKAIEEWPEKETPENHLTAIRYAISHSSASRTWILEVLYDVGITVFHTNDSIRLGFNREEYIKWLGKCEKLGMMFLPRVAFNDELKDILLAIKDHPALAGICWQDELDCFKISKDRQVKFAEFCEVHAPDVLRFATVDQGDWSKWLDVPSWDIVMGSVSPIGKGKVDYVSMQKQIDRVHNWLPPTMPFMITLQGYRDINKHDSPDALMQYNWFKEHIPGGMNSYSIYLPVFTGSDPNVKGFLEEEEMKESVKKLNEGR